MNFNNNPNDLLKHIDKLPDVLINEINAYIPKSVTITKNEDYNIDDFHSLNTDQIIACMYGTIQKLISITEAHDTFINSLELE